MNKIVQRYFVLSVLAALSFQQEVYSAPLGQQVVSFSNGALALKGLLYKPAGKGPFPTVLYNHGSAPGMLNNQAAEVIGPLYVKHGWAFFMPYRRGQGLSESAGPYIGDQIKKAEKTGGMAAAQETMVRLLTTDHLNDQMAALNWLKTQDFVQRDRIAVAGNSFGGIETLLGAQKEPFCAAISASGGAESWNEAPLLREVMMKAASESQSPVLFFQAENDFDLTPSKVLAEAMKMVGKKYETKFYPPFGKTKKDGHSFAYLGSQIWESDVFKFLNKYCGGK